MNSRFLRNALLLMLAAACLLSAPSLAQDVTAELVSQYGRANAALVQSRVQVLQSSLGTRYVRLLKHPGVFWHTPELIAYGRSMGTSKLAAMPLYEVLNSFGRVLGSRAVFRGVSLSQAELKLLLTQGHRASAFQFQHGAGHPMIETASGGPRTVEARVSTVLGRVSGSGSSIQTFHPISESVAISKAPVSSGAGSKGIYVIRMEIPEISLLRTQRLVEAYRIDAGQARKSAFGLSANPFDGKAETVAVDLIPHDSPNGTQRSPFMSRLHRLKSLLTGFKALSPANLKAVLQGGLLRGLAPATQLGRALRAAGIYSRWPIIQAELRSAGVEPGTLGGLRRKPPAELLKEILIREGVPQAKHGEILSRFGGQSSASKLILHGVRGTQVNLNQPYMLESRLRKTRIPESTQRALLAERSRGEFKNLFDFNSRMAKQTQLKGEAAVPLKRVVEGGSRRGPSAPVTPRRGVTTRLKDFFNHRSGGKSMLPGAARRYLAGPIQTLMTIMVFHAALQYRATGTVDLGKAVSGTLDSPQVWSGLAAAGASAVALQSLRKSLMQGSGARQLFARMLGGLPGTIAAFAAWEIGVGYTNAALEGVQVPGKGPGEPVTVSDMFRHPSVGGEVMGNLAMIAINPMAHAQILGKVFKERILTAEFAFTAAGMWAGSKVGAFAGVKVGAWAGAVFGPPGIGIGAAAGGIVGGVTGGVIGGFGGAWVGSSVDLWLAKRGYKKAKEAIAGAVADPEKRRELGDEGLKDALDAFSQAREKLVGKLGTDFAGKAQRYMSEKDLPDDDGEARDPEEIRKRNDAIMSRQREVEASRLAILDVYQEEIDLLGELIEGRRRRGEDDVELVERENQVLMDMTMFLVGSGQALGEGLGSPADLGFGGGEGGGPSTLRPEELPSYRELPAPAAAR